MSYNIKSLIEYGDRVQYGQIQKSDKELLKKKKENEENDIVSLKSYLDTILPPKESTESGQIYMHFVSCKPSTTSEVLTLAVSINLLNLERARKPIEGQRSKRNRNL